MDIEQAKALIRKHMKGHSNFTSQAYVANRYYNVENDIMLSNDTDKNENNPMRNADNRIPHSFYRLLVNQKTGYMFTFPPLFDVKNDKANKIIRQTLGDSYDKKIKTLCTDASNAGVAWLHYWVDDKGQFRYGAVPTTQCIPIWSSSLDPELLYVLRVYDDLDEVEGALYEVYELWSKDECTFYRRKKNIDYEGDDKYKYIEPYYLFYLGTTETNVLGHSFEEVPFIPFFNNPEGTNDLKAIKGLIDTYDKTYCGFMNDLEDIQEVIFIIKNYGGQADDLPGFLKDVKQYKTIQIDSIGGGDESGVSTLSIEIPVEARNTMLEITRKAIFDMGQGIDPQQQGLDATSGEAMKFLYALLELKAGLMETEFRFALAKLVRAIAKHHGFAVDTILQTWTRTAIKNDSVLVQMCSQSEGIISRRTILANHPFVDDVESEEKQLEKEAKELEADYMDLVSQEVDDEEDEEVKWGEE